MRIAHLLALLPLLAPVVLPASNGLARAAEDIAPAVRQCLPLFHEPSGGTAICIGAANFVADVCRSIDILSAHYGLPEGYFARLIWQESRFDPGAMSPAGAQGIAQFMPGTARIRGLGNAFSPAEALASSAEYLKALEQKYGNLGLAAAAYNAGEGRISRWIASGGSLAGETRAYVSIITGVPVETWLAGAVDSVDYKLQPEGGFQAACIELAKNRPVPTLPATSAAWKPWGVLIAQDFSAATAQKRFEEVKRRYAALAEEEMLMLTVHNPNFGRRIRHSAMVGRDSRKQAEALCAAVHKAGGDCLVVRN